MSTATPDAASLGTALADALEHIADAVFHVRANDRHASGVVLTAADHLVVTSSRLFHDQRDAVISARGQDGVARTATLVGVDETTELALIQIQALDDAPISEPSWVDGPRDVRVGQLVAPVGRTDTGLRTTFGMVARVGGAWITARGGHVERYVEVDGTLPPGFSGGPLVDFAGRVLGVNTRGLVPGGATVPTTTVRRVAALLAAGGNTAPGHLGVAIQAVELPPGLQAGATRGLLVTGVVMGSAAEAAGIGAGDVIVAIDETATADHAHLLAALAGKAGVKVKVRVARHGQSVVIDATPEARAERRNRGHHPGGLHGAAAWARFFGAKGCR